MRRSFFMVALCVPLIAFAEARSADLDKAARLVFEQKYEAAARALELAWRQTGNKRDTVLRILELQGVVYAQLGQEPKAKNAFQMLIALDPKRELSGKYSAKVLKPFGEAQAWAVDNPPLEVTAEPAAVGPAGKVLQIAVKVKSDGLKLAKKVRFAVRPDGGKWAEQVVDIDGAYASAGTDSDGIEWYAELLGEREMVLATVGSARAPVKEGKLREKEPVAVVEKKQPDKPPEKKPDEPKKDPVLEPKDPDRDPELVTRPADSPSNGSEVVRAIGYASLAVGMASLVAGTVMGGLSRANTNTLQQKIDTAERDNFGNVIRYEGVPLGGAQSYDLAMRDRIKTQALIANVLWGAGGGLAILGIVLYFVGRESADVAPGAGGIVFSW